MYAKRAITKACFPVLLENVGKTLIAEIPPCGARREARLPCSTSQWRINNNMLKDASPPVPAVLRRTTVESRILAAIPAYNEAATIGSVVLRARQFAGEVVVIDDGSTDDTANTAALAGAQVIRHPVNRGYGAAMRTCLGHARENGADILVVLDGDGQHRPELIPVVVAPVAKGEADVSIGSRFLNSRAAGTVPRYRRFGIGVITKLTNLGTRNNRKVRDAQSGFRAYSRAAIEAVDPLETNMGASTEILWEADRKGLRIVEVPIEIDYHASGSRRGPIQHGMSVVGSMIRYVETKHALLVFAVPGFILFLTGLGLGFFVLDSYNRTKVPALGLAMVTVLITVVGLLLGFTGLIMHAVINANKNSH